MTDRGIPTAAAADRSILSRVITSLGSLGSLLFLSVACIIVYEVVMRFVFRAPTMWVPEISSLLTIVAAFLIFAYTLQEKGHTRVDFVTAHLSRGSVFLLEIFATGLGVILPGCDSRERLWQQLVDGESQLTFEPVPTGEPATWPVGRVRDFDPARHLSQLSPRYFRRYTRDQQLYIASCAGAIVDAGLDLSTLTPGSVGIFDGTSRGAFDAWYEWIRTAESRSAFPSALITGSWVSPICR